jgi:pimeloyl-ACP methyl ester carboxylesterase
MPAHRTNGGSGKTVVLIHGNSLDHRTWSGQLHAAALAHLRLVALDLPSHGGSPRYPVGSTYTLEAMARDIAAEVADMEAPVLVGHSLGGHLALRVLASAPHVRGAFIFGAPPLSSAADFGAAYQPHPALANAFKADLTDAEARALAEAWAWPGAAEASVLHDAILKADPRFRGGIGAQLAAGDIADEQAMIRRAGRPVGVAHGADDPFINKAYLDALAPALFHGGTVRILHGCGHSPQLQDPAAFNAELARFVGMLA